MIKKFMFLLLPITLTHAITTIIKNDTKVTYFITCDKLGYLLGAAQEVKIEVPETSWMASWWNDPSVMTLFKKIGDGSEGDGKEFVEIFKVRPKETDDDEILILMSEVQRKARNVTAPFTVKAVDSVQ